MILSCLTYMVIGIAHVVVGVVLEPMLREYSLSYQDGGQIIMNQFLGFLIGVLGTSYLLKKLGRKNSLLLALLSMAVGEAVYAAGLGWGWMLAVSPFVGFGFGLSEALVGAFVIEVAKQRAAVAMSRVELFFSVGALAMPLLGAFLIQIGKWQISFWIVALISGLTFILWLIYWPHSLNQTADEQPPTSNTKSSVVPTRYGRRALPFLLVGASFFIIYVGVEMSFANYLPSILIAKGELSESSAAVGMGLFWAAMSIGRLFSGHIAIRYGSARYLLVSCTAALFIFVLLATVSGAFALIGLALLLGLMLSGMFAIALVFINDALPGMIDRTTSILVACGGLGGAIFPKLTGWMMDQFGTSTAQWFFSILSLLLLTVMIVMMRLAQRARAEQLMVK